MEALLARHRWIMHSLCLSGILVNPEDIGQQFRNAWLSFFSWRSKGSASMPDFLNCFDTFLLDLEVASLPPVEGKMLMDIRRAIGARGLAVWMSAGQRSSKLHP